MAEEVLLLVADEGKPLRNNRHKSLGRPGQGHPEEL